ncbi:MAG: S9 family peptidase [Bacteroidetes bacterium]|nr:MAG: S9 family peptidase [Bacteroidota bacterium]
MKKLIVAFILSLSVLMSFTGIAQEKMLTVNDAIYMNPAVYPVRVPQLQWMPKSDDYVYAKQNSLYKVSARGGSETLFLTLDNLNEKMAQNDFDSLKQLPHISFLNQNEVYFSSSNKWFTYNTETHSLQNFATLPDSAENIDFNKKTKSIAYTIKNNLFILMNGSTIQVTHDDNPGIVNGQTVHRVEFGINTGTFWSPDGKTLAFYRKDETMVADYPLVNIDTRIATVKTTKYPMAGETSHQVTLGVFNPETGSTLFLKTGEPKDHYLTAVTWDPSGKYIYIAILNRDQNQMKLNQYDINTGNLVKTLFEEENPNYVEPEHPLYFNPNKPDEFIWFSERDGFDHLYLYNTDGKLLRQLTRGNWVVTNFVGYFGKDKVFFNATKESPLEQNIYSVSVKGSNITRVSPDHGTHTGFVSYNGKYMVDIFSNTETAREYKLVNNKGKVIRVIKANNHPLKDYKLGKTTIFTIKPNNTPELYCRIITPPDFDSAKKYPVIVYVYGGPHAQLITDSWVGGSGLFLNYLAQQGYIVFTLDNRGSSNRGRDFEQAIFRNLGTLEVDDQMAGINYLKSLPYIDSTRIGVDGWSYGGFMTISLKLKNPGVFKVAVAGGPVIDWQYYEVMYGERYMDTPQTNPEGYKNASLLNYVDNLEGKLLVIHGTMDPTVVWQQSLLFLQAAIQHGKQMDYFVYPGHEHNVRGKDRAHLYTKITDYFKANL